MNVVLEDDVAQLDIDLALDAAPFRVTCVADDAMQLPGTFRRVGRFIC
jgi:hypothetical protein